MFLMLVSTYFVLIIALIVCIRIIHKENIKNGRSMTRLIGLSIFPAASYTLSILVPAGYPHLAVFLNGLYFLGTDWLGISLMFFVADYTRLHPPSKLPRKILCFLAVIDSISMIVNTFTRHIFTMERGTLAWAEYWQIQYRPMQSFHMVFAYLMVMYSLYLLVRRWAMAPKIYRGKYSPLIISLASLVVLNLICVTMEARFDYSVLIYGVFAISICYFVLYDTPRKLLEDMHSTMVGNSVIGLIVYDENKHCVSVNRAARELFDQQDDINSFAEQYLARWEDEYRDNLKNVISGERKIVKNGETMYIHVTYQKLQDEKERLLGYCFQFENRTDAVNRYEEETYRATHDALTGLLNRDAFEVEAAKILAKADEPYYMICTNIKDFKLINELCGTEVGDALLIAQAKMIGGVEYGKSVSSRIYADKFCTLMPKSHYDENSFKENMMALLERELSLPIKYHFYFGVYEIHDVNEPIWVMCDKAMMAIDSIRGDYGRFFNFYKEELFQRILKEKEILGQFDEAIEDQQFRMFLQPQITNDGRVVGAEALVRWIHPEKGMVSPADFIPALEKAGLIHKLDLYMWEKAAQKLEQWKKEGKEDFSISVNISTQDFYLIDIYEAFRTISEKYDFDIKNLKLEITESALMRDVSQVMKNMNELHSLGYDIEIDDFGSGYSSLGRLKDIHADILKIDMIFLQETEHVDRSTTIIKNVIAMSKELGMPVITEGVETKEQVEFLRKAGCDMFQGFYFARPMNVETFEQEYLPQAAGAGTVL